MSYLSTLVDSPPAVARSMTAAAAPEGAALLEQQVGMEMEAEAEAAAPLSAAIPAAEPRAAIPAAPAAPAVAEAARQGGVADALQAAFAWVASQPSALAQAQDAPELLAAAATVEVQGRSTVMQRLDAVVERPAARPARGPDEAKPQPVPPAQPTTPTRARTTAQRVDASAAEADLVEPQQLDLQRKPVLSHPLALAVQRHPPRAEDHAAAPQTAAPPTGVYVHIGSIALQVRTPPAAPPPAPLVAAPALPAAESARPASPAFAFSARRHHLRWS